MDNATRTNSNKAMTGESAINYAELHGLMLSKYADPIEGHRADLSPDEAREIMREDPSLIYLEVNAYHQPTGPMTLSGSMMSDTTTINGETFTNYDGTFSEAQPVIQRFLDALGWGGVASESDLTWGLSEEEWLVRDEQGRVCIIDTCDDTITR